jgi:hypothetical protein
MRRLPVSCRSSNCVSEPSITVGLLPRRIIRTNEVVSYEEPAPLKRNRSRKH